MKNRDCKLATIYRYIKSIYREFYINTTIPIYRLDIIESRDILIRLIVGKPIEYIIIYRYTLVTVTNTIMNYLGYYIFIAISYVYCLYILLDTIESRYSHIGILYTYGRTTVPREFYY